MRVPPATRPYSQGTRAATGEFRARFARSELARASAFDELRDAGDVHPDLVDAGARGDVERFVIDVAELDVGRELRRQHGPEVLALWRNDPYAARRSFPDVAVDVDLQAVGDPRRLVAADVDEHLAVGNGVVGEDAVAAHVLVAAAVRVQVFLV